MEVSRRRSQQMRLLLILLALSSGLHLFKLGEPSGVVFDEVHFGGFVNAYCCTGRYFFDIHPPHGKLLIAGVAAAGGYRGEYSFERINKPLPEGSLAVLRLAPALSGTLIPLLTAVLLLQFGALPMAAFLGGLALLLDNGLLLQTRIIALDGILIAATLGALSAFIAAVRSDLRGRRTAFAFLSGALAGLAAGCKFTGLIAILLIGVYLAVDFFRRPGWRQLHFSLSLGAWVLSAGVAVYALGWLFHFAALSESGPGNAWSHPSGDLVADIVRLHRMMLSSNYGLTASHPYSSAWWNWPLMGRSVFYWNDGSKVIYFLGNPVLWWGTTLGLIVVGAHLVLTKISRLRFAADAKPWPRLFWVPVAGYLISMVPLMFVPRPLFLYHYLTPLIFALCTLLLWVDRFGWIREGGWREQRLSFHATIGLLVVGFLAVSPFTFSFVHTPGYQRLVFEILPHWR